jgi:anti-anti-sigma factor
MPLETTTEGNAWIIKVSGRMNPELILQFQQVCQQSLEAGQKHLVVDIGELLYVSSLGLRAFVQLAKNVHGSDAVAVLCGMKGMVKEVFDMTNLGGLFPTFDSIEAAIASFR